VEADDVGWVLELIIAGRATVDNPKRHVYLVKWEGYSHDENWWESYENVANTVLELLDNCNDMNPSIGRVWRYKDKRKK